MLSSIKLAKLFIQYQSQPLQNQALKFILFKNFINSRCCSPAATSNIHTNKIHSAELPKFNEKEDADYNNVQNTSPVSVKDSSYNDELKPYPFPKEKLDAFKSVEQDLRHDPEDSHFIDDLAPPLQTSFNLAAFANRSPTIQKFIELNVDLAKIERKPEHAKFVAQLDFEENVKPYIQFLHDKGIPADDLGKVITKNPLLFKHDLENLQIRVNYFLSKKFEDAAIVRIIIKNPIVLSMDTKSVDYQLGYFQRTFELSGDEVRFLFTKHPQLISLDRRKLNEMLFSVKEEMGFTNYEMKQLLLMKPKLWTLTREAVRKRFDVIHNMMKVPHRQILTFPGVLLRRGYQLEQRHLYLKKLGRAQYNPSKPLYISLEKMATATDYKFCTDCAKTSVAAYNEFLKTL